MADKELSFSMLDARLKAIPDGPSSVLNAPRWLQWMAVVGGCGIFVGLLPSVLVLWFAPAAWMVGMAKLGLAISLVGSAPFFCYSLFFLLRSLLYWRSQQTQQLDHDLSHFRDLLRWLGSFNRGDLQEHLRMVRSTRTQLDAKLVLFAGGVQRLGTLPLIASLIALAWSVDRNAVLPAWLAVAVAGLVLVYALAYAAATSAIRFQLYEALLADALELKTRNDA